MKIFTSETKVNFVDENNVFVGYDTNQCCCENANWMFTKTVPVSIYDENIDDYNFDDFVFLDSIPIRNSIKEMELYDGGSVTFELLNQKGESVYLTLYNCHNGYYSHGFTYGKNDNIIIDDYL